MSDKKIIGLFSQLAGGKDTVANHLVTKLNEEVVGDDELPPQDSDYWKRVGFADAVKHVFMDAFNVTWDFIEEWKRKDEIPPGFDLNVRKALQHIGDGFRKIQGDVWIRTALRKAHRTVISDGRYLNEARMIKAEKGTCVLLWRPGFENNDPNPSESQIKPYIEFASKNYKEGRLAGQIKPEHLDSVHGLDHLDLFDYFLVNDGSLEDLYNKINAQFIPFLKELGV